MKYRYRISSSGTGALWGLATGSLLTAVGVGLWCVSKKSSSLGNIEPLAVAAVLVGIFATACSGHGLRHR